MGPLIGVCIFNCQIAGIPLKWVEHTLPFRVNEKRRPGRARVTDNDPGNKEGIHLQFFYFHQREKLKCILMGKCVRDFNPPSRAVFRCPILWSHTARVKQLRRNRKVKVHADASRGQRVGAEDREPRALSVQEFGLLCWDHTCGIQTCEISPWDLGRNL